jgi:hypothetical protein
MNTLLPVSIGRYNYLLVILLTSLFIMSGLLLASASAEESEPSPACVTHLTRDVASGDDTCSASLQRASRKTLRKYCTGEPLANNERTKNLILEKIENFSE